MLRLNLGSGPKELHLKGYENLDLLTGTPAYPLRYNSGEVDVIRASHLLEHFGKREVRSVLRDWVDKLRPGGTLQIAVPDFDRIALAYVKQEKQEHSPDSYIMGGQDDANDFHKSMFNKKSLTELMTTAGLQDIRVFQAQFDDCSNLPISLNLEGTKPGGLPLKTRAVMTLPRLGFTANMFATTKVFPKLGIEMDVAHGVFWGQKLSRLIDRHLNDGTEFIITLDYDTAFKDEHVIRLLQLMTENPDVDAIVPVQVKREQEIPMFSTVEGESGKLTPLTEFETELVPIINGHFGLTIFRVSAFEGLTKPWFLPHPNEDGEWGEGRIDEDIHFWHNFHKDGRKVCLATTVMLGHMQMMCTFPGPARNAFRPVHYYMNQLDRGQWPEHCVPKVELLK